MSPALALASRPVWNTNAPSASDACAAGRFSVGSAIRSHSARDRLGALPVRGEPLAEGLAFELRVVEIQASERERGAGGAKPLGAASDGGSA